MVKTPCVQSLLAAVTEPFEESHTGVATNQEPSIWTQILGSLSEGAQNETPTSRSFQCEQPQKVTNLNHFEARAVSGGALPRGDPTEVFQL